MWGKRKQRCHILTGNGIIEESVAACAQKQRRQKTDKDDRKKQKPEKPEKNKNSKI